MKHSAMLKTIKAIFKSGEPLTTNELVVETGLCKRTIQRHTKELLSEDVIKISRSAEKRLYQYSRAF